MVKQTQILSGGFATGENKKGNFTGYNSRNERIFIHLKAMEALGFKKDEDLKGKFPLFAIIGEKDIQTRDENGELTNPPVMTKRLQALSVFATKTAMLEAYNADAQFEIEAKVSLATSAKSAGLTEAQLNQLLAVA